MVREPRVHLVDEKHTVPVRSTDELINYFRSAGKPAAEWRVGSEHELVGVLSSGAQAGSAPPFEGPHGIGKLFEWFAGKGGKPILEQGHTIAMNRGEDQLTIEPGGQFELASRPVLDDRELTAILDDYTASLGAASRELGLAWLSIGLRPFGGRADVPIMPKQRYDVMREYMPRVGTRGLDMMLRTATVQANLDFADEADAATKMRCLYSTTSILTALWSASPIVEDKVTDWQSYRAWIWRDTDRARSGLLPFVFERADLFRAYMEWALDVPMYFIYRGGYRAVPANMTFRRYLSEGSGGSRPTHADWALHLSTLFPEGRLKKFIEVRGCDCGSMAMIQALAPFTRGMLYDSTASAAATALTASLSFAEREQLANEVPKTGLATRVGDHTVGDLAKELVAIVKDGLSRVAPGSDSLIAPVEEIATTGRTQSDHIVELWKQHEGDRSALIRALAHPDLI